MKTHFNDERPYKNGWLTTCASCRCDIAMVVENYPHGPQDVKFCAVCGTNIVAEKNGTVTKTQ